MSRMECGDQVINEARGAMHGVVDTAPARNPDQLISMAVKKQSLKGLEVLPNFIIRSV